MKSGIYIITNLITGHRYIGQTNDLKRRRWEHFNLNSESNYLLLRAYKKHGLENFSYEILERCPTESLNDRERFWIAELKPEYNRTAGGEGRSAPVSEEVKARLSEAAKRQWAAMSDEQKALIRKNNLTGPKIGHPVSKETREKLRRANLGKKQSPELIEKRLGHLKENGFYERLHEAHKRKVICKETGEIFDSVKSAMAKYGGTVSPHLRGKYKTCKGLHFEYLECRD